MRGAQRAPLTPGGKLRGGSVCGAATRRLEIVFGVTFRIFAMSATVSQGSISSFDD